MCQRKEYPIVECDHHLGISEPGYMICKHIDKAEDIAFCELATPEKLGCLACQQCADNPYMPSDEMHTKFIVCCAQGLRDLGYISTDLPN